MEKENLKRYINYETEWLEKTYQSISNLPELYKNKLDEISSDKNKTFDQLAEKVVNEYNNLSIFFTWHQDRYHLQNYNSHPDDKLKKEFIDDNYLFLSKLLKSNSNKDLLDYYEEINDEIKNQLLKSNSNKDLLDYYEEINKLYLNQLKVSEKNYEKMLETLAVELNKPISDVTYLELKYEFEFRFKRKLEENHMLIVEAGIPESKLNEFKKLAILGEEKGLEMFNQKVQKSEEPMNEEIANGIMIDTLFDMFKLTPEDKAKDLEKEVDLDNIESVEDKFLRIVK